MIMRVNLIKTLVLAVLVSVGIVSCTEKEESTNVPTTITDDNEVVYTIEASVLPCDVWTNNTAKDGETGPTFMCYLFGSDGVCINNKGNYISTNNLRTTFFNITQPGTYTIYCVTGWNAGEYPGVSTSTITLETLLPIQSAKDMCLGSAQVTVTENQLNYNVPISVDHIMAQLTLTIDDVPSDITSFTVTLPNQANTFKFDATIVGNTQSQDFELTKNTTANSDGTYNWTLAETIVFPSATSSTSMPITIVAEDETGRTYTFNTSSSTCCLSGTRTNLGTTWDIVNYYTTGVVTINPWTSTVQSGDFDMGDPTVVD